MGDAADALDTEGGSPGGLPEQASGGASGGSSGPKFSPAGALSIASLGLGAFSGITKAQGTKASYDFQEAKAKRAADFGRLQEGLTNTAMREQLDTTLSNIEVIRAAARTDPSSPTGAAIEARNKLVADRSRDAALLNIRSQVAEDEASAGFAHKAGLDAVANANLMAGLAIPAAVAKAMV